MELATVTPALAQEWLDTMGANRRLNAAHAERLADDMRNGDWRQTGDPVRFDRRGKLVDGQHRLTGIVMSGKAQELFVIRGLDPQAMASIDTGKSRSFADVLSIKQLSGARKIAAAAKQIWHYEQGSMMTSGRAVSHPQLQRVLKEHPTLPEAVELVSQEPAIQPHAILSFVYCLASELHPRLAKQWLDSVQEGEMQRKGMPAFELRLKLQRLRGGAGARTQMRGPYVAAIMIQSWNAFLDDETHVKLDWRARTGSDEAFPRIR